MVNYSIVMRSNPMDADAAKKAYASAQYSEAVSYTHLTGEDGQWLELPYLYAGSGTADCGGDRGALKGDCDGVRPDKKNGFPLSIMVSLKRVICVEMLV